MILLAGMVVWEKIKNTATRHAKPLGKRFPYHGKVHSLASCAMAVGASVAEWRANSMKART